MAVELTLQNGRWSGRALKKFLESWAPQCPVKLLTWMPWQTTGAGLRTWIFGEGSIRGVHIIRRLSLVKGAIITVRLNAMASSADWWIAYAFLRALQRVRGGRIVGPEGKALRLEDLSEGDATGAAGEHFQRDSTEIEQAFRRGERYAVLPSPEFDLLVTPSLLTDGGDLARRSNQVEMLLRDMAARYQRAAVVPEATLPNGRTIAVWSMDAALLPWADFIGVRQGAEATDGIVLGGKQVVSMLGSRLEVVSEDIDRFFVAAMDPGSGADQALSKKLLQSGQPIAEFMQQFQRQGHGAG